MVVGVQRGGQRPVGASEPVTTSAMASRISFLSHAAGTFDAAHTFADADRELAFARMTFRSPALAGYGRGGEPDRQSEPVRATPVLAFGGGIARRHCANRMLSKA